MSWPPRKPPTPYMMCPSPSFPNHTPISQLISPPPPLSWWLRLYNCIKNYVESLIIPPKIRNDHHHKKNENWSIIIILLWPASYPHIWSNSFNVEIMIYTYREWTLLFRVLPTLHNRWIIMLRWYIFFRFFFFRYMLRIIKKNSDFGDLQYIKALLYISMRNKS